MNAMLTCAYVLLSFLGNIHISLGLITLFICFITFECTIVTSFGVWTKMVPDKSATMNCLAWLVMGVARVCAALVSEPVWLMLNQQFVFGRIFGVGIVCFVVNIISLLAFLASWRLATRKYNIKL